MMKRLLFKLLTLAAFMAALQASAAMYIVGDGPYFGDWNPSAGVQMTDNGDGTYSYRTTLYNTVIFVFADGLVSNSSDWETFSNNYRYSPTDEGVENVSSNTWVTTQKNATGAYTYKANGTEVVITFDKTNSRFKITSNSPYAFESDGFYFNIFSEDCVTLTRSEYGNDYIGDVVIPAYVEHDGINYRVGRIGENAFISCHDMTSVSIPPTVTTIEESAFYYCTSLTEVIIPEGVQEIYGWNFYKSDNLTKVTLPTTLTWMGSDCFGSCVQLNQVTCKATTPPSLGSYCFNNMLSKTLYVPEESVNAYQADSKWGQAFNTITAMPDHDFTYWNLKFVITGPNTVKCVGPATTPYGKWTIPSVAEGYNVTEIGQDAFSGYSTLTGIEIGSNVETIESYAFYNAGLTSVDLGQVKTIGDCAFGDCHNLTSVTIPSSVTYLGEYGFGGCGLTTVNIPATLLTLYENPFYNCPSLTSINVQSTHPNYQSVDGVLFNKDLTELIAYPAGRTNTTYYIPESVTIVGRGAFGDSKLHSVTLPSRLAELSFVSFSYNESLTDVYCLAKTPPTITYDAFPGTIENAGITLYVPKGRKDSYQAANGWQDFPTIEEMAYDFASSGIYYNITSENTVEVTCTNRDGGDYSGSVTIPETVDYAGKTFTVTAIGRSAFNQCFDLTHVDLPSTLTYIGVYAFYNCYKLDNVTIPKGVTTLDIYAFCLCYGSNFNEVVIPENVTTVNYGAFYGCSNLSKVTIGGSVNNMGEDVFKNCTSLTKVICNANTPPTIQSTTFTSNHYSNVQLTVPRLSRSDYQAADYWKNFTSIFSAAYDFEKDGIFYNITTTNPATVAVTYMTTNYNSYSGEVNIPATVEYGGVTYTVTTIGTRAFQQSKGMTSVTMPNTIKTIGSYAFYYCQGLTNVIIPNSVETIGSNAFWICDALTQVVIPNSVQTIGSMAFRNCSALKRIVIGENVTSIGATCFHFDPELTEIICLAPTPPTVSVTEDFFSNYNAILRVPYGSHDAYCAASPWNLLAGIVSEDVIEPSISGDVNNDGAINVSDVTALINIVMSSAGNSSVASSNAAQDVNGDGAINVSDVTALINMLMSGGEGTTITVGETRVNYLINGVPFTMVKVKGGTFMMGLEGDNLAEPVHQVTLSDYCIAETEVTQALWQTVVGYNPSHNKSNENLPVENMTRDACQTFTNRLSQLTGQNFRLPTEAEWEFAARGGNKSKGYTYAGSDNIGDVAWYRDNSGNVSHVVATKAPNELGLYDMSGNVFEWCQDYYGAYPDSALVDPQGPASGEYRICRSSAYLRYNNNNWFKCGGRTYDSPTSAAEDTGLRLACGGDGEVSENNEGQPVDDHLFVRMGDIDNQVTIGGTGATRVAFWLDDDQIYTNAEVQALPHEAYNANGDLYHEITYSGVQFDLYVPSNLEIVTKSDGLPSVTAGERLPSTSYVFCGSNNETKIIDGVEYNKYRVLIYNISRYGTHFSGNNVDYALAGALKKDDGPLLNIDFRRVPNVATPDGDQQIIIANTIFAISEVTNAGWSHNKSNFVYGSGGNGESPRYQKYVRIKVK